MIKIALPGAAGRMGGMLIKTIAAASDLALVAATDRPDSPYVGQDAGTIAAREPNGVLIGDNPQTLFAKADVVIDFSSPAASLVHADLAAKHGTALVIGTTGLTADDEAVLRAAATKIPLVYCANTSVGVTLLTQLVEEVARKLTDGWDIEIVETHHHHKVDAPSGTALALGRAAAAGRGVALLPLALFYQALACQVQRTGSVPRPLLALGPVFTGLCWTLRRVAMPAPEAPPPAGPGGGLAGRQVLALPPHRPETA